MKRTLLLALTVSLLPFAAQAQTYNRLVAFGDSLTDNGNLYLTSPGYPPAPYNKRFTNQLVWAEYLTNSISMGTTTAATSSNSLDYAFGGSRTDALATPGPGMSTQVNSMFIAAGGTLGANDVVSLWGGANNIFQGLPVAAANPSTAVTYMTNVGSTAATDIAGEAVALMGKGAKTFMIFNLPDLGTTPQFSADPSASVLATVSSQTFNGYLDGNIKALAASNPTVNFVQIDMQAAFAQVLANPAAFGFKNVTSQCVATTACVTGGTAVQDTYMFWDGVHPTGAGHRLVAKVAAQYLYTPTLTSGVGMLAEGAYATRHDMSADLTNRLGSMNMSEGEGMSYVDVIATQSKRDMTVSSQSQIGGTVASVTETAYDQDMAGFRVGAMRMMSSNMAFGIGANLLAGKSQAMMMDANVKDISLDAGLSWNMGSHFVTATVGAGQTLYGDYQRHTLLSPINLTKNEVTATTYSANLQGGFHMGDLMPVMRLTYAGAKMGGFSETGPLASVAFEDRTVAALSAAVELHAHKKLSDKTMIGGMIGYEANLSSTNDDLKGKLRNNTALPFTQSLGELSDPGLSVGVGLSRDMGDYKLKARYLGHFGDNDRSGQSALVSVSKSF